MRAPLHKTQPAERGGPRRRSADRRVQNARAQPRLNGRLPKRRRHMSLRPLDDIKRSAFDRTKCVNAVVLHRDAAEGACPGSRHEKIAKGLKLDPPRGPHGRRKLRQPALVDIARDAVGIGSVERNHHHARRALHRCGSCHGSIRSPARTIVNAHVLPSQSAGYTLRGQTIYRTFSNRFTRRANYF